MNKDLQIFDLIAEERARQTKGMMANIMDIFGVKCFPWTCFTAVLKKKG